MGFKISFMNKTKGKKITNDTFLPLLRSFILLAVSLFAISIFSFSTILYFEASHLDTVLTSKGWNNLFVIFSFPINCAAASLALLTISVTIYRINQTQEQIKQQGIQIKIAEENSRLSNYFKYYEEFLTYFKTVPKRIDYKKLTDQELFDQIFRQIYAQYHGTAYYNFQPILSEEKIKSLLNFLEKISNSSLNKRGCSLNLQLADEIVLFMSDIEFHELKLLSSNFIVFVQRSIGENLDLLYKNDEELFLVLPTFFKTYFFTEFVLALLNFEGIKHSFDFLKFYENEAVYRAELRNKYHYYYPTKSKITRRRVHSRRKS